MRTYEDMTGKVVNSLTVVSLAGLNPTKWHCRCVCGKATVVCRKNLTPEGTKSCGCLNTSSHTRHGHAGTPTYRLWVVMLQRCNNPKYWQYPRFGALGTKLCDRWAESFEDFLSDVGIKAVGKTLTLIDPKGNFEPGNWQWSDSRVMQNTRKDSVRVLHENALIPISHFAKGMGISNSCVYQRKYPMVKLAEAQQHL